MNSRPTLPIALVTVLCGLLAVAEVLAARPVPYGVDLVRAERSWPENGRLDEPAGSAMSSTDELEAQLARGRLQEGPYGSSLAEPLVALGHHYRAEGDLASAQRLYRQALHNIRINEGLYSPRQAPLVRSLLATYRQTGDLSALDGQYDYFFRLFGSGRPPFDDVRLRAALEYLRWQREALRLEIDESFYRRLLDVYRLNEELLEAIALDSAVGWQWRRDFALSQVANLYLVQQWVTPRPDEPVARVPANYMGMQDEQLSRWEQQLGFIQRGAYAEGIALLQAALASNHDADGRDLAQLHIALGDWRQWHGDTRRAGDSYREAVRFLRDAGAQDTLQLWLGEPVELPDNGVFWQPGREPVAPVALRFDVSDSGRVSNVEPLGEEGARAGDRASRRLARLRFRPRWFSGEPEAVSGLQREYLVRAP